MKTRILKRTLGIFLCAVFLCASVPAQLALGPQRLRSVSAPTLRNRTSLGKVFGSGRPRLSFVRRVGGVAFDGVAKPANGLRVNGLALNYSPNRSDGERLSVIINNQSVLAPIYDWQLIPIAKFADSDFYSCFTYFGDLDDKKQQAQILEAGGHILNYHPSFANTLMGLRLFQLDTLVINPYSWDLVKDGRVYVLGAGEATPNTRQNKNALLEFRKRNPELGARGNFDSYVISDYRRQIVFGVQRNILNIHGEPSYYFVRIAKTPPRSEITKAEAEIQGELRNQIERLDQTKQLVWLQDQLIEEAEKFEQLIGDDETIRNLKIPELLNLLSTQGASARRTLLRGQSGNSLFTQLIVLRVLARILGAEEVSELSEKISNQPELLRAINPAVWDAGVNLLRYAAFFRYCKKTNPRQWALFMSQIEGASPPKPFVKTPTVMDAMPARRARR